MSYEQTVKHFSLVFFLGVNLATLGFIFGAIKLLFPTLWAEQLAAPVSIILITFICAHLVNAFIEFFFHRYILHATVIPFFAHFNEAHNHHHSLTSVKQSIVTNNKYPITEEEQHEFSFFPWWTLLVFALFITPFYVAVWVMFPTVPIFLAGYASMFFSIMLYELFHLLLHLPMTFWNPKFNNRYFGTAWKLAYTFHLRHHANVRCNESVSGFFGIPLPDLLFGTYVRACTLFPDQTVVPLSEYQVPPAGIFIRTLDKVLIGK